jgi:hypothetical protein
MTMSGASSPQLLATVRNGVTVAGAYWAILSLRLISQWRVLASTKRSGVGVAAVRAGDSVLDKAGYLVWGAVCFSL